MRQLPRRTLLRAGVLGPAALRAAFPVAGLLAAGCSPGFPDVRLRLATGGVGGVYFALGTALAQAWQRELGLRERPSVLRTAGSVQNLAMLAAGQADVVFSAADVADPPGLPERAPKALARVYDDVVQVVVPAESPISTLDQLRGRRVSVGAGDSGVVVIAYRLLAAAGLTADRELTPERLGIDESAAALREGRIDAFFWSGGLPTGAVDALAATRPIRLLDLGPVAPALRRRFPVYDVGTVTAGTYGTPHPVSTVLIRNFLLVTAGMPDDLARALVAALFERRELLVEASSAGRSIDPRSAIGTQPIALHPGAVGYYRDVKGG